MTTPENVNPEADPSFERRLADGTGSGDWHLTDADRLAAERAAKEKVDQGNPGNADVAASSGVAPQAVSQPGPTNPNPNAPEAQGTLTATGEVVQPPPSA